MPQLLSLHPLTLEQLPTPTTAELSTPGARTALDDLIAQLTREANSLLSTLTDPSKRDSSPDPSVWKSGKTFHQSMIPTRSYSAHDPAGLVPDHEGRRWFARISNHPGADYDKWRSGLLLDHSENEVRYIESCTQAERLHSIVPNKLEVWTTQYHLAFPTSNRDFTFAILTFEQEAGVEPSAARSFTVVSVPFHAPSRSGFVRAKYVSVEHVIQTQNGVKWVMTTASDAGGLVPKFISDMAMPRKIAEDVPSFQSWILKQ